MLRLNNQSVIKYVCFFLSNLAGVPSSQIVQKLEHELLSKYDKSVIPKRTVEKGVPVTLDLALNQIIDVVSLSNLKITLRSFPQLDKLTGGGGGATSHTFS